MNLRSHDWNPSIPHTNDGNVNVAGPGLANPTNQKYYNNIFFRGYNFSKLYDINENNKLRPYYYKILPTMNNFYNYKNLNFVANDNKNGTIVKGNDFGAGAGRNGVNVNPRIQHSAWKLKQRDIGTSIEEKSSSSTSRSSRRSTR